VIDVFNTPWNHLKKMVFDTAIRARDARISKQRTFAGKIEEIDHDIIRKIIPLMGDKEKHIYMHIATGGFWGEDHKKDVFDGEGKCPHCGLDNVGTQHILWQCPVINNYRVNENLKNIKVEDLPKCVLNGIPKGMGTNLTKDFWGGNSSIASTANGQEISNPKHKTWRNNINQSMQGLLNQHISDKGDEIRNNDTITTLFCRMRHTNKDMICPEPHKCFVEAPQDINVYTDGSWKHPQKWFLGIGGAGTFWPKRVIDKSNIKIGDNMYYKALNDNGYEAALCRQKRTV